MTLTRRKFGSVGAAGVGLSLLHRRVWAQSAKISLKVGGQLPTTNPTTIAMEEACAEIRKQSNGDIDIRFFPAGQLGTDIAMQMQVRQGVLDMMTQSGVTLQQLVPIAGISGMAFAFKGYSEVWPALDGDLGAEIRAGMEKLKFFTFSKCLDSGYRHVTTSTRPINSIDDFKGLKIRVPPSPVWVTTFTALGASPTTISYNELYPALQTKIADGQENPLTIIESAKFYEVQKYCSMTAHAWDGFWIIANSSKWQSLPADAKELISRVFDASVVKQREATARLNVELEASLKNKGLIFNYPEKAPFRDALTKAGFYADWKKKYGPEAWAKLEKYSGILS